MEGECVTEMSKEHTHTVQSAIHSSPMHSASVSTILSTTWIGHIIIQQQNNYKRC